MLRDLAIVLGVITLTAGFAVWDPDSGLRTWWSLRQDAATVDARIQGLRDHAAASATTIRGLREDPLAQERAIREDLGFARPGETIVRLGPPQSVVRRSSSKPGPVTR